jgi:hypothetical protein
LDPHVSEFLESFDKKYAFLKPSIAEDMVCGVFSKNRVILPSIFVGMRIFYANQQVSDFEQYTYDPSQLFVFLEKEKETIKFCIGICWGVIS